MKKFVTLLLLSILPCCVVLGQNAVLQITLANGKAADCYVSVPGQPKNGSFYLILKDGRTASHTFKLTRPEFVQLICSDKSDWVHKHFNYLLYLSPGDNLKLKADFNAPGFGFKVAGKGSNNNQPMLSGMENADLSGFDKDTLSDRVINAINAAQKIRQSNLNKCIKLYNPSATYIHDWKINLRYYANDLYNSFKNSNRTVIWQAYYRNYSQWQKITDSLFRAARLNNDAALAAFHYDMLVRRFLSGEQRHLSDEEYLHPEAFYKEWYQTDTLAGKKQFSADRRNLIQEKIINRYFTGKTEEYLYAVLFAEAAREGDPTNIPQIFGHFKTKYPNSKYVAQFRKSVDAITANQQRRLSNNMVFMAGNGTKINTLDEVLSTMKGKTVLVDMWGTWCGPCREEIEKNSAAIRSHFKDKGLTYLYIANDDLDNQAQWKRLIAYFEMEGIHLLANSKLTEDIMTRVNGKGFPTLFIIKKDGTFELSKTAYPIQRGILIKQLEEDLTQ